MHPTRVVIRGSPMACRAARCAPALSRGAHFYQPTNYYPRFPSQNSGSEFGSLFRMLDDFTASALRGYEAPTPQRATYQPRFDVAEHEGSYELKGELPGLESDDLSVEFSDPQTLVIKGRTERSTESGNKPTDTAAASEETIAAAEEDNSDAASVHSASSFVHATVEDDPEESSTRGQDTPAGSVAADVQQQTPATESTPAAQPKSTYWVSERSVGEFQRTFKFPGRIDQEAVKASLKNGILSIVIPKASAPEARRIQIE